MVSRRQVVGWGIGLGTGVLVPGRLLPASAQKDADEFVTAIHVGIDRSKADPRQLKGVDLKKVQAVLQRRLAIFGSTEGTVTAKSLEEIRLVVPSVKIDDLQLQQACREGRVEVRHLEGIRTSLHPDAPYGLDRRVAQGESTYLFRDVRSGSVIPTNVFLKRCPLVVDSDDLEPGTKPDSTSFGGGYRLPLAAPGVKRMRSLARRGGAVIAVVFEGELQEIRMLSKPEPPPKRGKKDKKKLADPEIGGAVAIGGAVDDLVATIDLAPEVSGPDEAGYLAIVLTSGALPGPLRVLSQKITNKRSVI